MGKVKMGPQTLFHVRPVLLVGANVNNKPNFMTAIAGGVANLEPPMISVAMRHERYTLEGIRQNMTFSVNIPTVGLVKETDYCGLVSGSSVNKVEACLFKVFYGKLNNAPLIEQCPVNLECSVVHILNLGTHAFIVGRIEEAHVSEDCLTNGNPDVDKVEPLIYNASQASQYHVFGRVIAKGHSVGKELKPGE